MRCGNTLVLNTDCMPLSMLPLSTFMWQDAIRGVYTKAFKVIETYDDWKVNSPSTAMRVPSIIMTSRYVKMTHRVRMTDSNIFLRDGHRCQYCGKTFSDEFLTLDHVHPRSKGGKSTWDNLTSACSPCNNKRGNDHRIKPMITPYKPTYFEMVERRKSTSIEVPDARWQDYLQWDEDKLIVLPPRK